MAAAIIVVITVVSGKSATLALKLQIPIMVAVGVSLVALAVGALAEGPRRRSSAITLRTAPQGFWYVFAVFFPAVTGFTAGIGMSGDLKDPRHSIPRGTLAAVATGTAVYLAVPVLLAVTTRVSPEELAVPGVVWTSVAVFGPWLVFPGLWGAILSSAFGSVLGGPRVLQALAADGLAPSFLARLSKTGQPTIATWVSGAIAVDRGRPRRTQRGGAVRHHPLPHPVRDDQPRLGSREPGRRPLLPADDPGAVVRVAARFDRGDRGDVPDQPVGVPGGRRARERAVRLPPRRSMRKAVG